MGDHENQASRNVVIFDGQCQFCRRETDRIRRWDKAGHFEFLDMHDAGVLRRFPRLAGQDLNSGMRLILADGRIWAGADAVREVLQRLPGGAWVSALYWIPGVGRLARGIYSWVARHRRSL